MTDKNYNPRKLTLADVNPFECIVSSLAQAENVLYFLRDIDASPIKLHAFALLPILIHVNEKLIVEFLYNDHGRPLISLKSLDHGSPNVINYQSFLDYYIEEPSKDPGYIFNVNGSMLSPFNK